MSNAPQWVIDYVQDCRDLWGIGNEWHITITVVDHPNSDPTNGGACWPDAVYFNAPIELARDTENDDDGRRRIFHEMVHVAMAGIDHVIDEMLEAVPAAKRPLLESMYRDEIERFIQRTTRAMTREIRVHNEQHNTDDTGD